VLPVVIVGITMAGAIVITIMVVTIVPGDGAGMMPISMMAIILMMPMTAPMNRVSMMTVMTMVSVIVTTMMAFATVPRLIVVVIAVRSKGRGCKGQHRNE